MKTWKIIPVDEYERLHQEIKLLKDRPKPPVAPSVLKYDAKRQEVASSDLVAKQTPLTYKQLMDYHQVAIPYQRTYAEMVGRDNQSLAQQQQQSPVPTLPLQPQPQVQKPVQQQSQPTPRVVQTRTKKIIEKRHKYFCSHPGCDRAFTNAGALANHRRFKHPPPPQANKSEPSSDSAYLTDTPAITSWDFLTRKK